MNSDQNEEVVQQILSTGDDNSSTGWIRVNCPFCEYEVGKADNNKCLGIFGPTGFWHCFRCSLKGRLSKQDQEEIGWLGREFEVSKPNYSDICKKPESYIPLYEEPGLSAKSLQAARNYLINRRVTEEIWKEFQIGACLDGKYAWRIVIPILDELGYWKGFVARDWTSQLNRKYDNSAGLPRNQYFFNHKEIYRKTNDSLYLVEGIFDAFSLLPNVISFLGKPSEDQIQTLLDVNRKFVVCLDGDARKENWALAQRFLLEGKEVEEIELPPLVDPGSLTRKKIECFLSNRDIQ